MRVEFSLINFGLCILIWIVQLIIYPSFKAIESARFQAWHREYTRRISYLVVPLMLAQVGLCGVILWKDIFDPFLAAQGVCILVAWLVTFFISVPCHQKLALDKDEKQIQRLIDTNWLRTVAWTMISGLDWVNLV